MINYIESDDDLKILVRAFEKTNTFVLLEVMPGHGFNLTEPVSLVVGDDLDKVRLYLPGGVRLRCASYDPHTGWVQGDES